MYEWRGGSTTVQELMKCRKTIAIKWVSSDLRSCRLQNLTKFDKSLLNEIGASISGRLERGDKWRQRSSSCSGNF